MSFGYRITYFDDRADKNRNFYTAIIEELEKLCECAIKKGWCHYYEDEILIYTNARETVETFLTEKKIEFKKI